MTVCLRRGAAGGEEDEMSAGSAAGRGSSARPIAIGEEDLLPFVRLAAADKEHRSLTRTSWENVAEDEEEKEEDDCRLFFPFRSDE